MKPAPITHSCNNLLAMDSLKVEATMKIELSQTEKTATICISEMEGKKIIKREYTIIPKQKSWQTKR